MNQNIKFYFEENAFDFFGFKMAVISPRSSRVKHSVHLCMINPTQTSVNNDRCDVNCTFYGLASLYNTEQRILKAKY